MSYSEKAGNENAGGSMRETATLIALLTIIVGVGAAWGLNSLTMQAPKGRAFAAAYDRLQKRVASLPRASCPNEDVAALRQATVDYTPVGSIPANLARPIMADPCSARK